MRRLKLEEERIEKEKREKEEELRFEFGTTNTGSNTARVHVIGSRCRKKAEEAAHAQSQREAKAMQKSIEEEKKNLAEYFSHKVNNESQMCSMYLDVQHRSK